MTKQTFDDFLKKSLTSEQYDDLFKLFNQKLPKPLPAPHRLTKIKISPEKMNASELLAFSTLLKKSPAFLTQEYHCGYTGINISEMEEINTAFQQLFEGKEVAAA
jgi:hypothetical protein